MVWWIPASWIEDLGSAERVSLYHVEVDRVGTCQYASTVTCDFRLPAGIVERHLSTRYGTTQDGAIEKGKRNLINQIKVLYPAQ